MPNKQLHLVLQKKRIPALSEAVSDTLPVSGELETDVPSICPLLRCCIFDPMTPPSTVMLFKSFVIQLRNFPRPETDMFHMRFEKKVEEARNSGSEICRRKVNVPFVLLENDFRTKPKMPTQPRSRCYNLVQASARSVDCGCLCCYDECKCYHFKSCTALIQNRGQ